MGVAVLGGIRVGRRSLRGRREQRLVAALVIRRRVRIDRADLIDLVWGAGAPPSAVSSLHSKLSRLRDDGRRFVEWTGTHYLVDLDADSLDVASFEASLASARRSSGEAALAHLDAGLAQWMGEPFGVLADEDFVRDEAARLRALRDEARIERLGLLLDLGRHADVLAESEALCRQHPQWEEPRLVRARALAATGRSAEAARELAAHRAALVEQTGFDPSPAFVAVETAVLGGEGGSRRATIGAAPRGLARTGYGWTGSITREPTLVGRARERLELAERIELAAAGRPAVHVVRGAAGRGRTRMLEELRSIAADHGMLTAAVSCHDRGNAPFEPIDEVLRQLGLRGRAATAPGRPGLALAAGLEYARQEAAGDCAAQLIELAGRRAVVVTIDDVDAADEATLITLDVLAATLSQPRPQRPPTRLCVATARAPGPGRDREVLAHLERIEAATVASTCDLLPLGTAELGALIEVGTGVRPSERLVQLVQERAGGAPLAVLDLLRLLRREERLRVVNGALTVVDGVSISNAPVSDDGVIRMLDPADRELVAALALLRPDVSTTEAALLLGLRHDDLLAALVRAELAGMRVTSAGRIDLQHSSHRAALRDQLGPARQQQLHLQIAARMGQPTTSSEVLSIAWHMRLGATPPAGRARAVYLEAADIHFEACQWFEASRYYELALGDDPRSAAARFRAGLAAFRCHDHAGSLAHLERAMDDASSAGDVVLWSQALVAHQRACLTASGDWAPEPERLVDAADRLTSDHPGEEAAVCALLAEMAYANGQIDSGRRWVTRARRAARSAGDRAISAQVEFAAGLVGLGALDLGAARDGFGAAEADAVDQPWLVSWTRCRLALVEVMAGRVERAEQQVRRALEVAEPAAAWADLSVALAIEGHLHAVMGRHDDALATLARAELVWRRSNYPFVAPLLFPLAAHLHVQRGDVGGAHAALDRWQHSGLGGHHLWRLAVWAEAGAVDALRTALARRPLEVAGPAELDMRGLASVVVGALVGRALGEGDLSLAASAALRELQRRRVRYVPAWPVTTTVLAADLGAEVSGARRLSV